MSWLYMQDFLTFEIQSSENKRYLFECRDASSPTGSSLYVNLEATHSGMVNGNFRFYRPDRMQDGASSWVSRGRPLKPVLTNHNREGECLGRVHKARYVDLSYQYASEFAGVKKLCFYDSAPQRLNLFRSVDWVLANLHGKPDYKGLGYIALGVDLTDPAAIQKVHDQRYLTVSVGFGTDAALCSVCHTDWSVDDRCDHELGRSYDGSPPMFLITGNMVYKEVSFVNCAADPWAVVTGKDSLRAVADSLAGRAFYLGLSGAEQRRRVTLPAQDLLACADSLNFLGADIRPIADAEDCQLAAVQLEVTEDMELKAIQAEIKSKDLTRERALALRQELEAAADQAAVKRTLTGLVAKQRANGWSDVAGETRESVTARVAGLDAHLAALPENEREPYRLQLEADAQAFGVEYKAPAAAPPPAAAVSAAAPAVPAEGNPGVRLRAAVDKLYEGTDAVKFPNKDKVIKMVEGVQSLHGALTDDERPLLRQGLSALLEVFYAESWLNYAKERISSAGDAIVAQSELDELHLAVEKGEAAVTQALADKAALLATNTNMVKDQKQTLARVIVAGSVFLAKPGFQGLNADQIQTEIGERSKRGLNSLQDALADLLKELPLAARPAASGASPAAGAVRQVADDASIAGAPGAPAAEPAASIESVLDVAKVSRVLGPRAAANLAARERFKRVPVPAA